jgi:hypothetical protein
MRGDIEDFGGRLAVRCPLHSYRYYTLHASVCVQSAAMPTHYARIALDTGEGLYMGMVGGVKSKGVKQRVHPTKIIGDDIYIKVPPFLHRGRHTDSAHSRSCPNQKKSTSQRSNQTAISSHVARA